MLIGGVVLLVSFALVERRLREPLIDMGMFRRRNVSGASIVVFVLDFAFGAVLFFVPLYLEELLGYDALKAGLLLLPASVTMMISMPLGGKLFERLGPVPPIVAGMGLAGIAMLLLGDVTTSTTYAEVWPPLALLGLPPSVVMIAATAPWLREGTALSAARFIGVSAAPTPSARRSGWRSQAPCSNPSRRRTP